MYVTQELHAKGPCLLNMTHSGDFSKYLNACYFSVTQSKCQDTVVL